MHFDINGKKYNRSLVLAVMMVAAISGALMQTSLGTALPVLMKSFDINLSTAQQATTWFLLANGIMVPVSAYLATRFSTKWLHVSAYTLLLIGVLTSMLTPEKSSYWWIFVLGRIIAGIAVGIMLPLLQIVILNMYEPNERAGAMGLMGLVVGMAPAFGPTLTGLILEKDHTLFGFTLSDHWTSIFILPLIFIIIALVLAPFLMKDILKNNKIKLNLPSLLMSTIGFGLFLYGFTNVSAKGWGDFTLVILPIISGVLLLIGFAILQLKLTTPFMDIKVFKNKGFTNATIAILLATMAMYGVEMMLPTYLQNIRGLTPLDSGLTLMWGALMMGVMSPIVGKLYNRVGIRRLGFFGFLLLSLGTIPFIFLTTSTPTIFITILYALRMAGIASVLMPLTTSAMANLPSNKAADGTAANNTIRQVSSSVVVALLTSVVQNIMTTNSPKASLAKTDPIIFAKLSLNASIDGFKTAFIISLVFAVLGLIFIAFIKNDKIEEIEVNKK